MTSDWDNVQDGCMLCQMEQKTKWYYEDVNVVVAEKLGGGPFIVWKEHKESLGDSERQYVKEVVENMFGPEADIRVMMNLVEDHYHAHIIGGEYDHNISDEWLHHQSR